MAFVCPRCRTRRARGEGSGGGADAGGEGGFDQGGAEPAVAVASPDGAVLARALVVAGTEASPAGDVLGSEAELDVAVATALEALATRATGAFERAMPDLGGALHAFESAIADHVDASREGIATRRLASTAPWWRPSRDWPLYPWCWPPRRDPKLRAWLSCSISSCGHRMAVIFAWSCAVRGGACRKGVCA